MGTLQLRDVFTAGGYPTHTYVDRSHLNLENDLRRAVEKGYAIVAITGPSKSGKTVLCHSVIDEAYAIKVDGGQISSLDALWQQILAKLGAERVASQATTDQSGATTRSSGELNVGIGKMGAGIDGLQSHSLQTVRQVAYDIQTSALTSLRDQRKALIIDDFHYITPDLRRQLVRAIKPEVFRGLVVVAISVPYKVFSVIDAENEMEGRFRHIEIPEWAESDLLQIALKGLNALNIGIAQRVISEFATESTGNPLLMQSFCYDACYEAGVKETQESFTDISNFISTAQVYMTIAQDVGLPIFKRLAQGPQSRSSRIDRPFQNGSTGDTYEAILAAMAVTGPPKELHYDDIRSALRTVLSDKHPQKHEVTNAINQMVEIAKEISQDNPAIDFENDTIFILNPFFRFYLRWVHRPVFSVV